jgi:hypothetical protein
LRESVCRVCGYDDVGEERYSAGGVPEYVICPCCGAESGVDDSTLREARRYRSAWVGAGAKWWSSRADMPAG